MFKLVYAYKSNRRSGSYLYLSEKDYFDVLPQALRESFPDPVWVMTMATAKHQHLTGVAMSVIQKHLSEAGYYLYIPPPIKVP